MFKRSVLAMLAIFVVWPGWEFLLHRVILGATYQETAELWRPMEEMKMNLMHVVRAISTIGFVLIYVRLVDRKSMASALCYGLLIGIIFGISMGYGTYSYMPIPQKLALSWFLGELARMLVGGLLLGLIVRYPTEPETDN